MSDTIDAPVMDAPNPAEAVETTVEATPQTAAPEAKPDAPANDLEAQLASAQKRINELNKENEKRRRENEAAERKAAEEQGKFKELYEKEMEARQKAENERLQIERERLLDKVAAKHGLPDEMRNRLIGDTPEELEKDAETMAKLIAKPAQQGAPSIDATARGAQMGGELTDARIAELEQRYRIPRA